jgi:glycosyltransferase involved in cell wall biosynthesis
MFSVIIPTHNRKTMLERCLGAIAAQHGGVADTEVIVVDDGSTDGTGEMLKSRVFPFAFTVRSVGNTGPGSARNTGAAGARGLYLAFTEDDVLPDPDWLAAARRRLEGGQVEVLEGRTLREGDGGDIRRFEPEPVPSFIPCNLFVRRDVFLGVGGYSEAYFDRSSGLYFREDADFGFRVLSAGHRVALADDVRVEHPVQFPDLASSMRHARRYLFDPLLYKNHPALFRRMIEVKTLGGLVVHRPMHYTSLAYAVAVLLALAGAGMYPSWLLPAGLAGILISSAFVRFKYQGAESFRLNRLWETAGFLIVPAVYLAAIFRGCIRFRSFGAIL